MPDHHPGDDLLDAIGELYGCGDIRFKYELEDARAEAVKARAALLAENDRLREALRAIDTHGKRLLIDQGRGVQAHITEALRHV